MEKKNIYMAFGKATELKENTGAPRKRYIGYTNVSVIGINPNKAEWEKLYGMQRDDEPTYLGVNKVNGIDLPQLRIDMIIKTDPEKSGGVEITDRISYFIANGPNYTKDGSKIQMIDIYGYCMYIDVDMAKAGKVPTGVNNKFIGTDMRPAYIGEEALTSFIKAYAGVLEASVWDKNTNSWGKADDLSGKECRLDKIESYFKSGNVNEIRSIPFVNQVRVLFGIKKTDDGKLYSDIYSKSVLKINQRDASWVKIEKEIKEAKERGSYPNTMFEVVPFKEYIPEMSEVKKPVWEENTAPAFGGASRFFNKG